MSADDVLASGRAVAADAAEPVVSALRASIPDAEALEAVLRPIVEGQIRSFANDHPEVLCAVNWFKPRKDRKSTFVNSVAKRIMRDLLCTETRVRIGVACSASTSGAGDLDRAAIGRGPRGSGISPGTQMGGVAHLLPLPSSAQAMETREGRDAKSGSVRKHDSAVRKDAPETTQGDHHGQG